ncbi:MAG: XdhC family protein [Gammaproteobacteria bacterium]|nr:XdhC family protein [Gammaproteobacteria bacterium]
MQAVDNEVLNQVNAWLQDGQACWLATVVQTWGSSPRPVGSLLACDREGHIVGSLSGGCVEDDLLEKLTKGELAAEQAQFFQYGITSEETEKLGLPCGGHLYIVVEPVTPDAQSLEHFAHLSERLAERRCVQRTVNLKSRTFSYRDVDVHVPLDWEAQSEVLTHTYGPRYQLFIIGAGMVSKYLADMAKNLDYDVTVCDPREHLINDFDVPGVHLIIDMPDDAVKKHATDPSSAIVALTHDPRIDDMGLMEALKTDAFYIGAMGSARTSASRRERLAALDLTPSEITNLHAPIGLSIGSKTPPEIAIAILAEITAVRQHQIGAAREQLAELGARAASSAG